jgi:uncharacterized protein (TIGR02453 family)
MLADRYFTPGLFEFLHQLQSHNNRDWFLENKERYEKQVRDPVLRFITDLNHGLHKINPHIVADPSPTRGSMMRIYRDIRFSKDKSPYKTFVAAHFWHDKGKEGATPGFYLRLEPGDSMLGAGLWHPEPRALKKIRDAIARDPAGWKRITSAGELRAICQMGGESLQRPPRGYDPNHPFIEDIKRKDFTVGLPLADKSVLGSDILKFTLGTYQKMGPFVQFLSRSIGLP